MTLSQEVSRQLEQHALTSPGSEVCGLLFGELYVPLTNASSASDRFEADPLELARALAKHGEPTAIFHTHPNGDARPSFYDLRSWYYPRCAMIIGTRDRQSFKLGIFRQM